ncbi:hypothetical protein BN6_62260 [Saccharothrix espanaensis DSM 44229]|uniref:Uncharacterized protein n=1 Tax=Saccharothrix espanaensis (strain ATCC 51144 / DSM 44229 / JCM 9112 / NBRC 15066 / NRRL 15764) TaxID=1179773 RepID=K0JZQ6_SACES|nr:hypothetical protein BN6_62260 [Saccharothrix espanaensis DSM 44229]
MGAATRGAADSSAWAYSGRIVEADHRFDVGGVQHLTRSLHVDAVQFTCGDGSVELLFTPEALRLMKAGG